MHGGIEATALWGDICCAEDTNIWLVPNFGYWSWPGDPMSGTMREVQLKAQNRPMDGHGTRRFKSCCGAARQWI